MASLLSRLAKKVLSGPGDIVNRPSFPAEVCDRSLGDRTEGAPLLPVSIVTVAFDTYFFTRLLVEKVREWTTDRPYEIIVVDRGSTDESLPWLKAQPDVRIVRVPQNGPGHQHGEAASEGIRQARHPLVVLLDSDAHPAAADWLRTTASRLNERVRLAGALVHAGHVGNPYGYYIHAHYMVFRRTDFGGLVVLQKLRGETTDTGEEGTIRVLESGLEIAGLPLECCRHLAPPHPLAAYARFSFGHPHFPTVSGKVFHAWYGTRVAKEPKVVARETAGNISREAYQRPLVDALRSFYRLDY
jgi:hypothetical protein